MPTIRVRIHPARPASYPIRIGTGLLRALPGEMRRRPLGSRYVLLTDRPIFRRFGRPLVRGLRRQGLKVHLVLVPSGERAKTREIKARVEDSMVRAGLGRDSALIALGGGAVGDLGGFVAATYCRGIPCVQVPTTLVAMADSAVGGKTAVDHPMAKNWIGAFHQPASVWMDVSTLATLPEREFRSGLAEVVKTAVIADAAFFRYLERSVAAILARKPAALVRIVTRCCQIKARIVERDERESGLRKILNFGHTIGHALERLSRYRLRHGEAVSIGMSAESRLAVKLGFFPDADRRRLERLLVAVGLPMQLPRGIPRDRLLSATRLDKKSRSGLPEYALPTAIGRIAHRAGSWVLGVRFLRLRKGINEVRHAGA